MALSDIYYQQPWDPTANARQQMQQGLGQLAAMPEQQARTEGQKLENERTRQNLPDNQASPEGQHVGAFVKSVMEKTPGYQPGHEARLSAELQGGGGLGAGAAPQGPMQGPQVQAPPQNLGPSGYGQLAVGVGGYTGPQQQQGFGPPQGQMPLVSSSGGLGGAEAPPQTRPLPYSSAGQADSPGRGQVQPSAPVSAPQVQGGGSPGGMSNRDVDRYMHMSSLLKLDKEDPRMAIEQLKSGDRAKALAERKRVADQTDKTRRDLARLMAAYKQSPEDKLLLVQLHEAAANHRAAMGDKAKIDSGLNAIVNPEGANAQVSAEDKADVQAQSEYHALVEEAGARRKTGKGSTSVRLSGPNGEMGSAPPGSELDAYIKANPGWKIVK